MDLYNIDSTSGTNSTISQEDRDRKAMHDLTFHIIVALCLASIVIITGILVIMVIWVKFKGWKSNVSTIPTAIKYGDNL